MAVDSNEVVLDVRDLEPPEPFVIAMDAINTLGDGQFIHMIHRRRPNMLYPELEPRGLESWTGEESSGLVHVLVWASADIPAKQSAQLCIRQIPVGS